MNSNLKSVIPKGILITDIIYCSASLVWRQNFIKTGNKTDCDFEEITKICLLQWKIRNELSLKFWVKFRTNWSPDWPAGHSRTEIVKLISTQLVEIDRLLIQRIDQNQLIEQN